MYLRAWLRVWQDIAVSPTPPLPPGKVFKAKFPALTVLKDYKLAPRKDFWGNFPTNLVRPSKSLVNPVVLERLALEAGGIDPAILQAVCRDLQEGARIGCSGSFRSASKASNAPSAYADGQKVTDAIADWVAKGFAFGPVDLHQIPEAAKISGIMTRGKPNGSVRIILNLSSPKGRAVNEGIDPDQFPTVMSSTTKWLRALKRAGPGCKMAKCDWSDAYKHLSVHQDDLDLQWFQWLGKGFCELSLVFGGASSAGLFDRLAKVVLGIVIERSGIDPNLVIQHLDDCCAAAPRDSLILEKFDAEFFTVAEKLGVRLAPRDDPQKSFGPSTAGVILGVYYDTERWTWAVPQEKLVRLLHDLQTLLDSVSLPQQKLWSIVGKIIHIKPLVASGRYHMYHLIKANSVSLDPQHDVPIGPELKRQAWFWYTMIQVCSGRGSIPDPDVGLPAWALDIFTDAAGGSWMNPGQGVGAVAANFWVVMPWGRAINAGRDTGDGRRLDRIMSALELMGPLLALCAAATFCRGTAVRMWVDNAGSVFIYRKGYSSSCRFSSALVSALGTVAAGLGCSLQLCKITRCSNEGAFMADCLSKGAMEKFRTVAERARGFNLPFLPLCVPKTLMQWARKPVADFDLGERLLKELKDSGVALCTSL